MSWNQSRGVRRRPSSLVQLLVAIVGLLTIGLSTGCGGSVPRLLPARADQAEPWTLPAESFPTQRLYRVRYQGPEGEVGIRLTLYLEAPDRYTMEASDSLGRKVWSLGLQPSGRALWLDHRQELYCRVDAAGEQSFLPLAHMPLEALPRLILGLLPVPPAGDRKAADLRRDETGLSYLDASGRLWSGRLEGEALAWWSVRDDGGAALAGTESGGEGPVAWWRRTEDGEAIFSDRRGAQQVRWTEQVREALGRSLDALEVPRGYREAVCVEPG